MTGIIKTYLEEKQYGFIVGDDKKDYFFHYSSFKDKNDLQYICENSIVSFEQKATPKGYTAINITLDRFNKNVFYEVPDTIYTSRDSNIKGWEIIELSNWIIHGSSRNSPDSAKNDMIHGARLVNANSLLNVEYYKTTGSEPGTGKGTYYFTIHNFRGRAANIGKKVANGRYSKESLQGINYKARNLKSELRQKTNEAKKKRLIFWGVLLGIVGLTWLVKEDIAVIVTIGLVIFGAFVSHATDYDSWLEER